jgi:hypothetical protein
LLAGVYTGVDNFSNGLNTLTETLGQLKQTLKGGSAPKGLKSSRPQVDAESIFKALKNSLR